MNKILVLLCLGFVLFSCKSKKAIVTKKRHPKTERVVKKVEETKAEKTISPITKTYASATEEYIDTYADVAKNEMSLYGIPASITLAQGILESGSGNGRLSTEANNHFGIKCHEWTGARIYHDDDEEQECFRKYVDAKYSFRDHSLFLTQRKRYAGLFKLKSTDYKGWAKGLKSAGYATDPKYPNKLISLIERYDLDEYDGANGKTAELYRPSNPDLKPNDLDSKRFAAGESHIVVKGDTLYYISKIYGLSVDQLKTLNNLKDNNINIGQELQVSPN
ncbi:glucosaminidase domain-containing protein [Algibacter miyuki]|uniref:Peptidoglycan hydrolase n=1 Tax=Algibacter miyuki TaxID=1306933 RepID=A0ABV5GX40_9FLAO|nr:glucosaminidase domain-containing protein [Algibacter miyuki]MDN3666086.1 glucosaminidase domain-containing protein [Algibacter miyuki]